MCEFHNLIFLFHVCLSKILSQKHDFVCILKVIFKSALPLIVVTQRLRLEQKPKGNDELKWAHLLTNEMQRAILKLFEFNFYLNPRLFYFAVMFAPGDYFETTAAI